MQVVLIGDVDDGLAAAVGRHLTVDIVRCVPVEHEPFLAVIAGEGLPSGLIDDPRLHALVLVEPPRPLHDLVIRRLAGQHRPGLEVVQSVAERLHAERTWTLLQMLAFGIGQRQQELRSHPVTASHLVDGPPAPGMDDKMPLITLAGATLGCIGFGLMAQFIAPMAAGAGMEVVYWRDADLPEGVGGAALAARTREAPFAEVLSCSDIVMLDVDYSDDSIRLIDADALAAMNRHALLVNTSHGRAVDEGSLIQALRSGLISGAALDRFNYEPLPDDSPLRDMPNVVLTPGYAYPSRASTRSETARLVAGAVNRWAPDAQYRDVRVRRRRRKSYADADEK